MSADAYILHVVEGRLGRGPVPAAPEAPVLHPSRLWAVYHTDLVRRQRSPRTIGAYRQTLFSFWAFINPKPPLRAGPKDLGRFLNKPNRSRGHHASGVLSESSRVTYARQIRGFYRWAANNELTSADRMASYITPKAPEPVPRALLTADLATLFDHLELADDPRLKIIGWLAYFAALRVGEISRLRVEHIHLRDPNPWLHVHGKGGKVRQVPIGPDLARVLHAWLASRPRTGPLLPDRRQATRNIGPKWVSMLLSRAMHDAGLTDSGHALRHSWATDTLAAGRGMNLRAVSYVLGHASTAVTERIYTRSYRADAVEAVGLAQDPRRRQMR